MCISFGSFRYSQILIELKVDVITDDQGVGTKKGRMLDNYGLW